MTSPHSSQVAESGQLSRNGLLAAIERRLREHPLLGAYDLEFVRTHEAPYSEVFEYRHRSQPGKPPILVKRRIGYDSTEAAAQMAAREFSALERLQQRSGSALEGTVPPPLALFPEFGALVTEKLPGKDLREILWRQGNRLTGPFRQKRLCRIARLVGEWLGRFHESTRGGLRRHDSGLFMAEVKTWMDQCPGLESAAAQEIWALSLRVSQPAEGHAARTAAKHGDFIPVNILVDGDHIAVLDFEDFRDSEAVYEDVGMFRAYLAFMKESARYSPRTMEAMALHFMEGYRDLEQQDLVNLYTVRAALNIAACQFQQGAVSANSEKLRRQQKQLLTIARNLLG